MNAAENVLARMRRPAAAAAVVVLLLSGCGAADRMGSAMGDGVTVEQAEWMTGLCDGLGRVVRTAASQPSIDRSDVRAIPGRYAEQMRVVAGAVDTLTEDLDRLGPPPVDDGPTVLDELREAFRERGEAVQDAARFIEAEADPTSTIGIVQAARAAQAGYIAGPRLVTEVSSHPALEDPFAATPACERVDAG